MEPARARPLPPAADHAAAPLPIARVEAKNIVQATVPLHPGAAKFYEEQGIVPPGRLKAAK